MSCYVSGFSASSGGSILYDYTTPAVTDTLSITLPETTDYFVGLFSGYTLISCVVAYWQRWVNDSNKYMWGGSGAGMIDTSLLSNMHSRPSTTNPFYYCYIETNRSASQYISCIEMQCINQGIVRFNQSGFMYSAGQSADKPAYYRIIFTSIV